MTGGGALSHQITGLRDSTSHDIQVRAVNSAGDGPWSDVSAVATSDNDGTVGEVGQLNATHLVHIDYKAPRSGERGDRKNDPGSSGWAQAGVKYGSTSDRYNYSHDYGFGAVDAGAAVELAKTWTLLPAQRTLEATSGTIDLSIAEARSDGSAGAATTTSLTLDPFVQFIEYIEVRVTSDHPSSRDLQIELRSPSATTCPTRPTRGSPRSR